MAVSSASFPKQEHLCSTRLIETLFGSGSQSMAAFPLRAVYKIIARQADDIPVKVLISVSKKHFRHAVDRNRVKRQVREAYRQQKQTVIEALQEDQCLLLAFIWMTGAHSPSTVVDSRMKSLLKRISAKL